MLCTQISFSSYRKSFIKVQFFSKRESMCITMSSFNLPRNYTFVLPAKLVNSAFGVKDELDSDRFLYKILVTNQSSL